MLKPIQLSNGINVILVPQKGAESVTVQVFVKVGSRYEDQKVNGVSHFIEHLMFKGTKRRPTAQTITRELDRFGAEYNAFTGKDITSYYVKIDAKQTKLAVDLLHDMLFHSKYDAKEINRERGVIIEEINMYEDNPQAHVDEMLDTATFGNHPVGRPIAGPREVIRTIKRESIIDYRDRYYIPSRITIVAAGMVDKSILAQLEKTFGKIKEPKKSADQSFEPFLSDRTSDTLNFLQKQTEQVQLGLSFLGIPHSDKDIPAMGLLSTILGGSMSSRLFTQVREKRGLCYTIYATHSAMEDTGQFNIMAGLEKSRLAEAVEAIASELKKMKTKLVDPVELQHAKDHIRGRVMLAFEDSASQADWYGRQWMFQRTLLTAEERMRRIQAVKATDIRDLAKRIFDAKKFASAVIGPFEHKEKVEQAIKKAFGS